MVWLIRRRDEVRPICPMKSCFCLDNRMGCFICTICTAITVSFALVFVILDLISWGYPEFQVDHRFPTYWRNRFWKGFVLCDIVMVIANLILLIMSVIVIVAIVWPARYRAPYLIFSVMYFIVCYVLRLWFLLVNWAYKSEVEFVLGVMFLVAGFSYFSEVRLALFGEGDPEVMQEVGFLSGTPSAVSQHTYAFPKQ